MVCLLLQGTQQWYCLNCVLNKGELVYGMQFVHLLHSLVLVVHKRRHAHWCSLVLVRKTYANLGSV